MSILMKFFSYLFLSVLIVSVPGIVYPLTFQKTCGKFIYQVDITNHLEIHKISHTLSAYEAGKTEKNVFYKSEIGMLVEALCIKDTRKKNLLIFHEQCSGNACNENIYGVYDPDKKKFLLSPRDWPNGNSEEVWKITGLHSKFLDGDYSSYFCCSEKIGEIRLKNKLY